MKIKFSIIAILISAAMFFSFAASARENGANGHREASAHRVTTQDQLASSCTPATAKTDLDVNNVRTTIMTGGDMWWDLSTARYEIPKDGKAHSIFAGALWVGGLDAGGQLKVAAMTYRQTGNDFWPGPLDTTTVSIDATTCQAYDKHWKITRKDVDDFALYNAGNGAPGYTVPLVIQSWPGNGDASLGQGHYLAPFVDVDGDGYYNWAAGDYPAYDLNGTLGCSRFQLFGDQTLWWVFNDKGNVHSETGAAAIGLEVQAQAFGFSTNDEINNMTFYRYKVINRSTVAMNDTYFGQWTDADLGAYDDDYVGCDVSRGLGYTYNGDANDGTSALPTIGTYGANPPAIGMDFFEGPLADPGDGIDNNRNGVTDEPGEQIIMSKFVYYNNDFSVIGNPENGTHYYNYLSGFWKDGSPFTYGGNAYGGSIVCDFMFPGDSDPQGWGTNFQPQPLWSEASVGNTPFDRRMMQSAGPFTLQPGAVNYITVGAVWARASSGGPTASVNLMRTVDDKAQRLFNNCFRTLDGPDAPDMTIQELDKQLVLYLTNKSNSNNYLEKYEAYDPSIVYSSLNSALANIDTTYDFEGYQIFQLKDATVTTADLYNLDKARLVQECDLRNGVTQLVNREFDQSLNADVPQDMTIEANDVGIAHSFDVTEDAFATGSRTLINNKTYYFLVLSYAYNQYLPYADVTFDSLYPLNASNIGQKKPYLAGRRNVKIYSGIPHITSPEANGTLQLSNYASGPKLTRMEGSGSGQNVLDLTEESENAIVAAPPVVFDGSTGTWNGTARVDQVQYQNGKGPVNIKVIDPLNVPDGIFNIKITNNVASSYTVAAGTTHWVLNETSPSVRSWASDTSLTFYSVYANEQIIPELGMSVTMAQVQTPGLGANPLANSALESSITFADPSKSFLTGVVDEDGSSVANWIRAGDYRYTQSNPPPCAQSFDDRFTGATPIDANGDYEKLVGGTWGPYRLCDDAIKSSVTTVCYETGLAYWDTPTMQTNKFENLANVDVVLTNNRAQWTRVPVFEVGSNPSLNAGGVGPLLLRSGSSVDQYGRDIAHGGSSGSGTGNSDFISGTGMSWFPGYAVNVETGERLNIAFGENSSLTAERGNDMLFNPTADEYSDFPYQYPLFGGQHYIYIFGHNGNARYTTGALNGELKDIPAYDYGKAIMKIMSSATAATDRNEVFRDAMWCSIPMLNDNYRTWSWPYSSSTVIPTDVKVRLRLAKPYKRMLTGITPNAQNPLLPTDSVATSQNGNNPMYYFDTHDLKVTLGDNQTAQDAMALINIVPNPYYAYSAYEKNQIDNRVKFTCLPENCTIRIYTVNGTQVRKLTKASAQTYLDWDLKNQAGIPIASGLYIIHIEATMPDGSTGEKILKWFGVMRPIDLDAY
ncbi:MAG: T9SS C-terminal target domain-containing protein [Bacteroidetes bacterium]|nr:T9SS C-terminal target domain-containing protein [Bacteroidota bacterium]